MLSRISTWMVLTFSVLGTVSRADVVILTLDLESLQGNLIGDPSERTVTVYLPPSYFEDDNTTYPVIYLLHGVGDTDARWRSSQTPWRSIESIMDLGVEEGSFGDMIVIMPSCRTKFLGGCYTDSPVHGKLETYITQELVEIIDDAFRTRASREFRGVAGHSMGGTGAMRVGMRHPDVFGSVYSMNGAIFGWHSDFSHENLAFHWASRLESLDELPNTHFWTIALLSGAHAWSPDIDNPPFYAHLPFKDDGRVPYLVPNEPYHSMWESNLPLYMIEDPQVQANLKSLKGLQFDSAFEDEFTHIPPTNRALSERMTALGIPHTFEMYNGDHRNRLLGKNGRLHLEVFPFFWRLFEETED